MDFFILKVLAVSLAVALSMITIFVVPAIRRRRKKAPQKSSYPDGVVCDDPDWLEKQNAN